MLHRKVAVAVALLAGVSVARAHFVFVVPEVDRKTAKVILSEELQPDKQVPALKILAGTKLNATDAAGKSEALQLTPGDNAFTIPMSSDARVIYGVTDLGLMKRGETKPGLLIYYPKTIVGNPFDAKTGLNADATAELVPVGKPGELKFKLLVDGKPKAGAEVAVLKPDGKEDRYTTDKNGLTETFDAIGRYGAWARNVMPIRGEKDGQPYEEIRHYATLVIDVSDKTPAANVAAAKASSDARPATEPAFIPMPQKASSFGAVTADGYLYVYGGHVADTHDYSTATVSNKFHRLNLAKPSAWEELPGGPNLQGLNLASWNNQIIRVGGMSPANQPGEETKIHSQADVSKFDPATGQWTNLPALPSPRSSHDVAVVGNTLYVTGGWTLTGEMGDSTFRTSTLSLDLSTPGATWQTIEQPFKRRVLIAAVHNDRIYVIGGFDENDDPSRSVDIFDPKTNTWSRGPGLPGPDRNGFGPAAATVDGKLYASVGDGSLLVLNEAFNTWDLVTKMTPRIVHRMVADGSKLLILGGARGMRQTDLIEPVDLTQTKQADAAQNR